MSTTFQTITTISGGLGSVITLLVLLVKPFREKLFGLKEIRDGERCVLRSEMLKIYYRHREDRVLHQYEYENFVYCYKAYKALKGNSFIDKIYEDIQGCEVIP